MLQLKMLAKLIVAGFACYRLAQLVVYDDGPFRLFDKLRIVAGCYDYGEDGQPQSELGRLLSCPYCVGIWIALPLALVPPCQTVIEFVVAWFAIAGLQALLEQLCNGRE
jgi:hypothetical protein